MRRFRWLLLLCAIALGGCGGGAPTPTTPASMPAIGDSAAMPTPDTAEELTVFAAASLTGAFNELGAQFSAANGGVKVTFNFGGSDQLATQIVQGAPADVFASASPKQMDVVISAGEVAGGSERTFVRNRLVAAWPQAGAGQQDRSRRQLRAGLSGQGLAASRVHQRLQPNRARERGLL
jgi:molybdate transport system substrate-binding protein